MAKYYVDGDFLCRKLALIKSKGADVSSSELGNALRESGLCSTTALAAGDDIFALTQSRTQACTCQLNSGGCGLLVQDCLFDVTTDIAVDLVFV